MKKTKDLLKSSYLISFMTVLSRVTGLLRDLVFANLFGASSGMDAFLVAFRIPNFMRRLFAEGAFSQAFVPTLSKYRQTKSPEEVRIFLNHVVGIFTLVLLVVTTLAMLAAPLFVFVFAPGFIHEPTKFYLAAEMLRVTFPYLFFISLTACAGGILNSYDSFGVPAFTPVLLNVAMIAAATLFAQYFANPIEAAAWGVFFGGVIQLLFQIPFLKRIKLLPKPQISWQDPGVRQVVRLMVPAIIGVSMAQIGLFIDMLFASFLREGSISWLYYSDRLTNFPLGVFGVAIATVILPHLSRKNAAQSPLEYSATLDWGLKCILFIGVPAAVGMLMLADPLLSTILQHGKFNPLDVKMAGKSLMAFAIGIPSFMLVKILAAGFYSRQDIKTPVKIAVTATLANIACNFILILPLAHAGLALATSISSSFNAGCLLYLLRKRNIYQPQMHWRKYLMQLSFATILMALFLYTASANLAAWVNWNTMQRIFHLAFLIATAGLIYLGGLFITGIKFKDFRLKLN